MKDELIKLLDKAYAPYSKFHVAAMIEMVDGKYIPGVNVENANGTSICAERNAISACVAAGYKKGDVKKIYLMLSSGEFGTPCFACRQVLLEFMNKEDLVISVNKDGLEKVYTIEELCPYPFDDEDLK